VPTMCNQSLSFRLLPRQPSSTLFPYTTLFRSERDDVAPVGRLEDVELVLGVVAREAAAVAAQRKNAALVDDLGAQALPRVQWTSCAHERSLATSPRSKRRAYSIAGQRSMTTVSPA